MRLLLVSTDIMQLPCQMHQTELKEELHKRMQMTSQEALIVQQRLDAMTQQ